jgi:hypothetical protein
VVMRSDRLSTIEPGHFARRRRAICDGALVAIVDVMNMNNVGLSLTLMVSFVGPFGCSGTKAVPIKGPEAYAANAQYEGVAVGAEAYDTWAKSDSALGTNVTREFTPVHIVVENRALEKYLVLREQAQLTCSDGTVLEPVSGLAMFDEYRGSTLVPAALGARIAASATSDDNDRMASQWVAREFPEQAVLAAGRQTRGFLYFRGACSSRLGRALHVTFDKLTASDAVTLKVALK